MGTKYYTPEIKEFHVGFEFEAEINGNWISTKIYDWYDGLEGNYRVKHLDREDIESLGFLPIIPSNIENKLDYFVTHWTTDKYKDGFNILLSYPYENSEYEINTGNPERSYILFKGTIKNKFELQKLMKMLNIQ